MFGKVALSLVLLGVPFRAEAPLPDWELVPAGFVEVNLCLRECDLKSRWANGYEYRERRP